MRTHKNILQVLLAVLTLIISVKTVQSVDGGVLLKCFLYSLALLASTQVASLIGQIAWILFEKQEFENRAKEALEEALKKRSHIFEEYDPRYREKKEGR